MVCIACAFTEILLENKYPRLRPGGGGTHYNGIYEKTAPERRPFSDFSSWRYGFHEMKYRKGYERLSFRYLKRPFKVPRIGHK